MSAAVDLALPDSAHADDDTLRVLLAGTVGVGGELHVDVPGGAYPDVDLEPSLGAYTGASYAFMRFLALEAGISIFAWRADGMNDRELAFDLLGRPTVRLPLGRFELYAALPIGLTVPVARDTSAQNLNVTGTDLSGKLGWTVGAALGAHVRLGESGFGARAELAYQQHWLGYTLDDVQPEIALDASFAQALLSLGVSYAVF